MGRKKRYGENRYMVLSLRLDPSTNSQKKSGYLDPLFLKLYNVQKT